MKFKLFALLFLFAFQLNAQKLDIKDVLEKAEKKLSSLETLSYWIDFDMKYLSDDDTTSNRGIAYLKHIPDDSMGVYHNIFDFSRDRQQIYNGENILNLNFRDSSSLVVNTELYGYGFIQGNYIKELIRYNLFRDSLFSRMLNDTSLIKAKLTEVTFRNIPCYSVEFAYEDDGEVSDIVSSYYFHKEDFFPFGYKQILKFQNMVQYKSYLLTNLSYNPIISENLFDLDYNILHDSKIENYVPREREPLLSAGESAPQIIKKTIQGEDFNLNDYRGKIVIFDFWYRSCYPCIKALPDLQKISSEFADSDVVVVGVNPFDSKSKITQFLSKRDISYTNIYDSKDVAKDYKVNIYPTLYILDKEGKIHQTHIGWGDSFYEEVTSVLKELNH